MSKVRVRAVALILAAAMALPVVARAAPGTTTTSVACPTGDPAILVHVTGFKVRSGTVRVQAYGGDPEHYFDKGTYLKRIEVKVPASGPLDVCVPVGAPGRYAISVRHDVDGAGKTSKADGGGMSGNPHVSLFDLMFKRKPSPDVVAIEVGRSVKTVPITLNYLQGGSFRPVEASS